jgi:hypothetical protein
LPKEAELLRNFDRWRASIEAIVDMPNRTLDKLFGFLRQNGGRLSKRAREGEFAALTDQEVGRVEDAYAGVFGDEDRSGSWSDG